MKVLRVLIDILLFVSIFFLPWWLFLIAILFCIWIFPSFYEGLVLGLLADSLYNAPVARLGHIQVVMTLSIFALLVCSEIIKRKLRFYS